MPPTRLRRFARRLGLHPFPPERAPLARSSGAVPRRDSWSVCSPFRSVLPVFYASAPFPRELRGHMQARPGLKRLASGFCTSTRGFAPRFFQRRPRGRMARAALRIAVGSGSLRSTIPKDFHLLVTPMLGTHEACACARPSSSGPLSVLRRLARHAQTAVSHVNSRLAAATQRSLRDK